MAYTLRKKRHCVKQALLGMTPISEICRNKGIPRMTLYRWIKWYNMFGEKGLENLPVGRKPENINPLFVGRVYKL